MFSLIKFLKSSIAFLGSENVFTNFAPKDSSTPTIEENISFKGVRNFVKPSTAFCVFKKNPIINPNATTIAPIPVDIKAIRNNFNPFDVPASPVFIPFKVVIIVCPCVTNILS